MPSPVKMPIRAVRAAYETGDESIRAIARRYGISDCAIRKRAKAEGWIRSQREVGSTLLTEHGIEGVLLTEQDIDAMIITTEDLARMSVDPLFGWR